MTSEDGRMARYTGEVSTDGAEEGMNANIGPLETSAHWGDPLSPGGPLNSRPVLGFDPASGEVVTGRRLSEGEVETGRADRQESLGKRFTAMLEEHGTSAQKQFNDFMSIPRTVVFDIDGVLSDSRWRLPLIRNSDNWVTIENRTGVGQGPETIYDFAHDRDDRRWGAFYELMEHDKPFEFGVTLLRLFRRLGFTIEFWTGRPDVYRFETVQWLMVWDLLPLAARANGVELDRAVEMSHDWLYMRDTGSRINARQLKRGFALQRRAMSLPDPNLMFDDDMSVVQEMNELGIAAVVPVWHGEEIRGSRG